VRRQGDAALGRTPWRPYLSACASSAHSASPGRMTPRRTPSKPPARQMPGRPPASRKCPCLPLGAWVVGRRSVRVWSTAIPKKPPRTPAFRAGGPPVKERNPLGRPGYVDSYNPPSAVACQWPPHRLPAGGAGSRSRYGRFAAPGPPTPPRRSLLPPVSSTNGCGDERHAASSGSRHNGIPCLSANATTCPSNTGPS
jgi:hypothetical protein